MRRVFEGGEGLMRGGKEERSIERGVRLAFDFGLDDGEAGGEAF